MAVGTTAAVLGTLAAGGASAAGSYFSSKAAREAAQRQADFFSSNTAAQRELEGLQVDAFRTAELPALKTQSRLYQQYAPGTAAAQYDIFSGEAELEKNLFQPGLELLGSKVFEDLDQAYGLDTELSDRIFQETRRRVAETYEPKRQAASERLAATGGLGSGAANQLFADLDQMELEELADLAFEQALAEIDYTNQQKQQAYLNALNLFNVPRNLAGPAVSTPDVNTQNVGANLSNLGEQYTAIPEAGIDYGALLGDATRAYGLLSGAF